LYVAVADRPDLRRDTFAANERIVRRNGAVGIDAYDLAEEAIHALRLHPTRRDGPLALRHEQFPVASEHQPAAEVLSRVERRMLMVDHLHVLEARRRSVDELRPRNSGVVHATARLRV